MVPGGHVGFFVSHPVREFIERSLRSSGMVTDLSDLPDSDVGSEQSA